MGLSFIQWLCRVLVIIEDQCVLADAFFWAQTFESLSLQHFNSDVKLVTQKPSVGEYACKSVQRCINKGKCEDIMHKVTFAAMQQLRLTGALECQVCS